MKSTTCADEWIEQGENFDWKTVSKMTNVKIIG